MPKRIHPDNLNLIRSCTRASLHVLIFPISLIKGTCDHIKNEKLLKEKFGLLPRRQKIEIYDLVKVGTHLYNSAYNSNRS